MTPWEASNLATPTGGATLFQTARFSVAATSFQGRATGSPVHMLERQGHRLRPQTSARLHRDTAHDEMLPRAGAWRALWQGQELGTGSRKPGFLSRPTCYLGLSFPI